ncbi:MAG: hypothetical protein J7L90_00230 [Dehalococcoidia bacterium]|nr:hypothetical protein [Dehalococcoidia bacterium]
MEANVRKDKTVLVVDDEVNTCRFLSYELEIGDSLPVPLTMAEKRWKWLMAGVLTLFSRT